MSNDTELEELPEIKDFPDYDTYMKSLGLQFDKEASMCQGKRITIIYRNEKAVVQLIAKESFLEGVIFERD